MGKQRERTDEELEKLAEKVYGKDYGELGSICEYKTITMKSGWMNDLKEENNEKE